MRAAAAAMSLVGSGNPPLHRFRVGLEFAISGRRDLDGMIDRHAALARALAERLGLPEAVQEVGRLLVRAVGRQGLARRTGGRDASRSRHGSRSSRSSSRSRTGWEASTPRSRSRNGVQARSSTLRCPRSLHADPEGILGELDSAHTWNAVIEAEPALRVTLAGDDFDRALLAIADFVDLKSPYTLGHARAVAELAAAAASSSVSRTTRLRLLRRAGFVHDLGRLGVSNAIWDKPGPLGVGEWERVRLHPYLTERMLHQSAALAPLAAIAVQHRERLDGSGYPKGLSGASDLPTGPDPRRGRRVPVDARAAAASPGAEPRGGGCRAASGRRGRASSTPTRWRPCSPLPAIRSAAAASGRPG